MVKRGGGVIDLRVIYLYYLMSFRENFTREEKKDDVQYDDSAFFTFGATILLVVIVPLAYSIIQRFFSSKQLNNKKKYKNCQCSLCKTKLEKFHQKSIPF